MPSPMKRITLRALRGPVAYTSQLTVFELFPSLTTMVYRPGLVSDTSRRINADAAAPSSRSTNVAERPSATASSVPSMVTFASDTLTTPSNSTLRSKRDPTRI
jgi:hypothetical protein